MLDSAITDQLNSHMSKVKFPIELIASLDDSAKSAELRTILSQIADLSEHIGFSDEGQDARRPSFEIARTGTDIAVRFAGIPLGHEFTSLVLALLQVGGHPANLDPETLEQIPSLDGEFHFETYMSLTCQNCPDVVQALNTMSVNNPRITHVAIDGGLFLDEIEARGIKAVPTVYLNGEMFDQGRMSLEQIVGKLDSGSEQRAAEKIAAKDAFDVLVVGGGPAGAAAAIYAARKGIRTGVVTERFGGQVLDTMGIENLISVPYTEGPKLVAALEQHVSEYDVDVMKLQQATNLSQASDGRLKVALESGASVTSKSVILATGARWRQMGIPGETEYRNKGVTYCPHCDGPLFKGKRVAVIGGGNSGAEAAIDLAGVVEHVTLLEFMDEMRADDILQKKLASMPNVDTILSAQTTEVLGNKKDVTGLRYTDRPSGESHHLKLSGIFVQIGLLPNTEWLEGAVDLSPRGEIVINDRGATSVPGVFAAGDCTTTPFKQIVVSLGTGATASLSAFDHLIRAPLPGTPADVVVP